MGRSPCCDKAAVNRGPWSAEEDARLRSYIERHGGDVGSWLALPRKAGLRRCGKSCRLRWLNYLRPGLRRGGFTPEEDTVICALYAAVGSRWSFIAAHLPGRTDNGVKNYWNTRLRKKLFAGAAKTPVQLHHDDANAGNFDDVPPCWSSQPYAYGAMGCAGDGGDVVRMNVRAGGVFTDMIASTNEAAAMHPSVDTSYSSEPAATELDEIFRSIDTSGGEHSDLLSQSSMVMYGGPELESLPVATESSTWHTVLACSTGDVTE